MSVQDSFYSLDYQSINISDFFKNLYILSEEGTMVFVFFDSYIKNLLQDFCIDDNIGKDEIEYYNENSSDSDNIIRITYNKKVKNILLGLEDKDLSEKFSFGSFLFFNKNNECITQWIGAGKHTSVQISVENIEENVMRIFCRKLVLNTYCVQFFPYSEIDCKIELRGGVMPNGTKPTYAKIKPIKR